MPMVASTQVVSGTEGQSKEVSLDPNPLGLRINQFKASAAGLPDINFPGKAPETATGQQWLKLAGRDLRGSLHCVPILAIDRSQTRRLSLGKPALVQGGGLPELQGRERHLPQTWQENTGLWTNVSWRLRPGNLPVRKALWVEHNPFLPSEEHPSPFTIPPFLSTPFPIHPPCVWNGVPLLPTHLQQPQCSGLTSLAQIILSLVYSNEL